MSNPNIAFYHRQADILNTQYNSRPFEVVHQSWLHLLDQIPPGARVCDLGAGNGRDAAALGARGFSVYAVEPAKAMREIGLSQAPDAVWLDDQLPELNKLLITNAHPYDLILISGVWMHLSEEEQQHALHVMAELLSDDGFLVILLRQGEFSDERTSTSPTRDSVMALAKEAGLKFVSYQDVGDAMGRMGVQWGTLVLSL